MLTAFVLWALGLIFIVVEFYLPGMVMGVIGGIMLVASVIFFGNASDSGAITLLYIIGLCLSIVLVIQYVLKAIPRSKSIFNIYSSKDQEGYRASTFDASAIGKKGIVVADLKPGGYILVDGKKHQAISQSGYVPSGSEVQVISGEEESLIVIQL